MYAVRIALTFPLADAIDNSDEYRRGYVDALMAPISAAIDAGILNVGDMLDAGWEVNTETAEYVVA